MPFDYRALRRDIDLLIDETLSDEAQIKIFVAYAKEESARFEDQWRSALGKDPVVQRFVDGDRDATLSAAKVPGTILYRVQPIGPIGARAIRLIEIFTKVRTGGFQRSNAVFINDALVSKNTEPQPGQQMAITFLAPFARKAEVRRFNDKDSSGFRLGLLGGVVKLLKEEFAGAPVPIRMTFRDYFGDRQPTILIG